MPPAGLPTGLCNAADPAAPDRPLNNQAFTLGHFGVKLFNIAENIQIKAGQALADQRTRTMQSFVSTLMNEITGGHQ